MSISQGIWPSLSLSSRVLRSKKVMNLRFLEFLELAACVSCGASNLRVTWSGSVQSTNEHRNEYERSGTNS